MSLTTYIEAHATLCAVYFIHLQAVVGRLEEHTDDVNAVAYLDDSSHILLSGSDDCRIKVGDSHLATVTYLLQLHTQYFVQHEWSSVLCTPLACMNNALLNTEARPMLTSCC
jgi:WD40 repeat protein